MTAEQLRQHYLQAMGIESYVARWALPGAAESLRLEEQLLDDAYLDELSSDRPSGDEPVGDEHFGNEHFRDEEHRSKFADAERGENPSVSSLRDTASATTRPSAARPTLNVELDKAERKLRPVETTAAQVRSLRFVLSAWQISDQIMVLDSRQLNLALPVERLLRNIAVALGLDSQGISAPELLRWPMGERNVSADAEQNEANARAHVQAFLGARSTRQPIKYVLLMGVPAIQFSLHGEQLAEAGGLRAVLGKSHSLNIDGVPIQAIALPSLVGMLQRPMLKAVTWSAIKHLRPART